jgi:hypothetical protein
MKFIVSIKDIHHFLYMIIEKNQNNLDKIYVSVDKQHFEKFDGRFFFASWFMKNK